MCKTCNGKGKIIEQDGYCTTFYPCPDTNCDFVSDDSDIERLRKKVEMSESA